MTAKLFLLLFLAQSAFAYIPPSRFIAKMIARKHDGIKGIKIRTQVMSFEDGKPTSTRFDEVTVLDYETHVLKSWVYDSGGTEIYEVEKRGNSFTPTDALLLDSRASEVVRVLKDNGIPMLNEEEILASKDEPEWVSRWEAEGNLKIAWVIGMKKGPELWVEKDTFLPLRLLIDQDIRFSDYRFHKEFPYPDTIKLFKAVSTKGNGSILYPAFEAKTEEVTVDPNAKDLKRKAVTGYTDAGNSTSFDMKGLIRHYYETLR